MLCEEYFEILRFINLLCDNNFMIFFYLNRLSVCIRVKKNEGSYYGNYGSKYNFDGW